MAQKKHNLSLFIFRRDLRLSDNTGLIRACTESNKVIPAFFLQNDLIDPTTQKYRPNLLQFMFESLCELDSTLKGFGSGLYLFFIEDFERILKMNKIEAVYLNEDVTPYSRKRDNTLKDICLKNNINFHNCFDLYLTRPGEVLTREGKPYKVFTSFYNKAKKVKINNPVKMGFKNFFNTNLPRQKPLKILNEFLEHQNKYLAQRGGRSNSLKILKRIETLYNYNKKRDYPALAGTTKISAHLKFGTVSIREVYQAVRNKLQEENHLITELFWRDFYAHLSHFFPYIFKGPFNKKYQYIEWENNKKYFDSWCSGETGFPIVDAGMRQLNKTGWMHNRARMIVASFLTKDLLIDWRWGERYFASKLVDYDPASNNGGWQWAASTGADSQPYFRIFNPWRQQKKFDPNTEYIKHWIPELSDLTPEEIHNLEKVKNLFKNNYPKPIVDHRLQAEKSKNIFKKL
ncbi:MAG: deoxyribodipyrimidine photo-lyase [Candidatus Dadabacteria bacterium]|nr:deoxyribodipyrimidine photo-lyase [Candidatus Dadabacteria bacterium]NIQ15128.1 deoxyribodipyrimidine photo-lyase [Candidatus Dadabacteria bacterium]